MSNVHAADGLLYASRSLLVIDTPTKRVELHSVPGARAMVAKTGCERFSLLLTGIRASSADATGVRVSIGKVQLGVFSLYGLEAGTPRSLSFEIPQLPAISTSAKTVALTMELLGYRNGSISVESVKIWCDPPGLTGK